jgi:hypothetical protein
LVEKTVKVLLQAVKRHTIRREAAGRPGFVHDDSIQVQPLEELIRLPRRRRQTLHPGVSLPQKLFDRPNRVYDIAPNLG